jgi:hypothetical protein
MTPIEVKLSSLRKKVHTEERSEPTSALPSLRGKPSIAAVSFTTQKKLVKAESHENFEAAEEVLMLEKNNK